MLALLGAGGAAAAAATLPAAIVRAGHDGTNVLHLGEENTAPTGKNTAIAADVSRSAFHVTNASDDESGAIHGHAAAGIGVLGSSQSFRGVYGHSDDDTGVQGDSINGAGVFGASEHESGVGVQGTSFTGLGTGVEGSSVSGAGVRAFSESGHGVFAGSNSGTAIDATSDTGVGVLGWSPEGTGVVGIGSIVRGLGSVPEAAPAVLGIAPGAAAAVRAASGNLVPDTAGTVPVPAPDGGLALDVIGQARFSTAGNATIGAEEDSHVVPLPAVTADSHVSISLTGDPGDRSLKWVERDPGIGFRVHFVGGHPRRRPTVTFSYLMVEPGE